jgi:hypothetical protein
MDIPKAEPIKLAPIAKRIQTANKRKRKRSKAESRLELQRKLNTASTAVGGTKPS